MITTLASFLPSVSCRIKTTEKKLFLTFDDGPIPEVTPQVLDMLEAFHAKATFFCIGNNIERHPGIFNRILNEGHAIGNHTFHHLNGWQTSSEKYSIDTEQCSEIIAKQSLKPPAVFRPPYGKLTPAQYGTIRKRYHIVLWDVLTRDWESNRSAASCFRRIQKKATPGSIVVFHDSIKARDRMIPSLQMTLEHYSKLGYSFDAIEKHF